ncbi:MAG: DUF47 family protein [Oscillospiraceae bacterium]
MSKKNDDYYYDSFEEGSQFACDASELLEQVLRNFEPDKLSDNIEKMHDVENAGDRVRHELISHISRAFITPIERDDIIKLSQHIDDITDAIEDVLIRLYVNNVSGIREDAISFTRVVARCCTSVRELMREFRTFKKSKKMPELIIDINRLEEEGDRLYIESLRRLHTGTRDALEIIAWREIYEFLEKCCDACEHVADVVESIAIENV